MDEMDSRRVPLAYIEAPTAPTITANRSAYVVENLERLYRTARRDGDLESGGRIAADIATSYDFALGVPMNVRRYICVLLV